MEHDLTKGNVFSVLVKFSIPYLLSCFLQTFYGLADLFIIGQFREASAITAVSIGSQLMHMLTVIIAGLAMGTTVNISRSIGEKNKKNVNETIGNSISFFIIISLIATIILLIFINPILKLLSTPKEAFAETRTYCLICFSGIVLITAYNIISSIFRGMGDTRTPLFFVLIAGIFNIILDYIFIGVLNFGAGGAAGATVISQGLSVCFSLIYLRQKNKNELEIKKTDLNLRKPVVSNIIKIGLPIALQDGFIQISFLVITAIANSRGVNFAAAVGIVEKIISFLFLVPSAMLSSVSAIVAQNIGAQKFSRGRKTLGIALLICVIYGAIVYIFCQIFSEQIVNLFSKNGREVIILGGQYLRSYAIDCMLASIHFCFSGYFCACGKSVYSFIHNMISIILLRIPGAYFASIFFPETLFPMGFAAPMGSLLSDIICLVLFIRSTKHNCNFGENSQL